MILVCPVNLCHFLYVCAHTLDMDSMLKEAEDDTAELIEQAFLKEQEKLLNENPGLVRANSKAIAKNLKKGQSLRTVVRKNKELAAQKKAQYDFSRVE